MNHIILDCGWGSQYVINAADAQKILEVFTRAQRVDSTYIKDQGELWYICKDNKLPRVSMYSGNFVSENVAMETKEKHNGA